MKSFFKDGSHYRMDLEPYCENCPNFQVEDILVKKTTNEYGRKDTLYHTITCSHMDMCDQIYAHILNLEKEKQKEETKDEKSS